MSARRHFPRSRHFPLRRPAKSRGILLKVAPIFGSGPFSFPLQLYDGERLPMELNLGTASLSDDVFLRAFEACHLDPAQFRQADHILLSWLYVHRHGARAAEALLLDGIHKMAQHAGAPQKFHYTITIAWARLVAAACCKSDSCDSFCEWIKTHPQFLDRYLLKEHYSAGKLGSLPARCGWLRPDFKHLD